MIKAQLTKLHLPDRPGVYRFLDVHGGIMYIGKATSLSDRVRSYFANDLLHTRGKHIVDMVALAHTVSYTVTDSVLEAVILEASLIKTHQPFYNTKEKDNKSFNYIVITNEAFPRILRIRERTMLIDGHDLKEKYQYVFGPFPEGTNLSAALKLIRKIFPFRDSCTPAVAGDVHTDVLKPCFNRQIGLCPGVCTGEISTREYREQIRNIVALFEGKKHVVITRLRKAMNTYAKHEEFEKAGVCKKMLFGLMHINDVSLIREEIREKSQSSSRMRGKPYRIEAYDVAHIGGKFTVGVMVVVEDGIIKTRDYRKFKIRHENEKVDDTLHLDEILRRRFSHREWSLPDLIVIDGGVAQKRRAAVVLKEVELPISIVSVVKDKNHKPKAILGNKEIVASYQKKILLANAESHRFAIAYHRQLRDKIRG